MKNKIGLIVAALLFAFFLTTCALPDEGMGKEKTTTVTVNLGSELSRTTGFDNNIPLEVITFTVTLVNKTNGNRTSATVEKSATDISATAKVFGGHSYNIEVKAFINGWSYAAGIEEDFPVTIEGPNIAMVILERQEDAIVLNANEGQTLWFSPIFIDQALPSFTLQVMNFAPNIPSTSTLIAEVTGSFEAVGALGPVAQYNYPGTPLVIEPVTGLTAGTHTGTVQIKDDADNVLAELPLSFSVHAFSNSELQAAINNAPSGSTIVLPEGQGFNLAQSITINKEITLAAEAGGAVTITRPEGVAASFFVIENGGKLTLEGTGTLTISSTIITNVYYQPVFMVNTGGELILGAGTTISNVQNTNLWGSVAVNVSGGMFTMTGSTITGFRRNGAVSVNENGIFNMSGGQILSGDNRGAVYSGGVNVFNGTFTMSGNAVISNNEGGSMGGGVHVGSDGTFYMEGGTISDNFTRTANDGRGGGVFIRAGGTFEKTGGTIYGLDEGAPDWNRITEAPNPADQYAGRGYAVYFAGSPLRFRDSTAGPTVNLNTANDSNWGQ
ncbi:MAG: hypothetical protein FWG77_02285 [Treponema sp.]|nr:hypothetical protein [Treponema sp.]